MLKTNKTNVGADAPVCPNSTKTHKNNCRGKNFFSLTFDIYFF